MFAINVTFFILKCYYRIFTGGLLFINSFCFLGKGEYLASRSYQKYIQVLKICLILHLHDTFYSYSDVALKDKAELATVS